MNLNNQLNINAIKIVLLGESGVGKSSIVLRFVNNTFRPYSESTIGASFMTKLMVVNNIPIKYHIWDTAGQERYHSLAPMYYRGASVAIVVYDITNKNSFITVKKWIKELKEYAPKDILITIVGNKSDLLQKRKVSLMQVQAYSEEINAIYLETSAKDNKNIIELFTNIGNQMSQNIANNEMIPTLPNYLDIKDKSNYCC